MELLEEKIKKMEMIIKKLDEKCNRLELLLSCIICNNITHLYYCSSCYTQICENCCVKKERKSYSCEIDTLIFCQDCS